MKLIKELPDPFVMKDGKRVATVQDWNQRREEIKDMMLNIQYGTIPDAPEEVKIKNLESRTFDEGETCEKLRFEFIPRKSHPHVTFGVDVTIWRPSPDTVAKRKRSVKGYGQNGIPALIYVGGGVFRNLLKSGYMMICYENNQLEPMEEGNPIVGPARKAYKELEPKKYSWIPARNEAAHQPFVSLV